MELEPLKIGILLTRVKSELKKDEMVYLGDKDRNWIKSENVTKNISAIRNGKRCVPGDVSIGLYIEDNWENVNVDFIFPEDISPQRLKENHINYMVIYDLLESFHVDKPEIYKKLLQTLENADNIYPPYKYQKFINNKCSYIEYLRDKSENDVIPTKCIQKNQWDKDGTEKCHENIVRYATSKQWNKFIGKPVFGQESIDFTIFDDPKNQKTKICNYIKKCFEKKKYPGIIFQKYIEGFDGSKPEIRMYYIGKDYQYSVITNDTKVMIPKSEKGTCNVHNMEELRKFSKKIVNSLPSIEIQGVKLDKLLTRVDIACNHRFGKPWIVNEVEFVPSLYIEDINTIPEPLLGDKMVSIGLNLIKKSKRYNYITK